MSPRDDDDHLHRAAPASISVIRDAAGNPVRLGHGGNRGSCVYLVECAGQRRALKACGIGPSELSFCRAVQQAAARKQVTLHGGEAAAEVSSSAPENGLSSLALPLCLVTATAYCTRDEMVLVTPAHMVPHADASPSDTFIGIVMPCFDCSLHRLLTAPSLSVALADHHSASGIAIPVTPSAIALHSPSVESVASLDAPSSEDGDGPPCAFHITPRQRRVTSLVVLAAMVERIVAGVSALHNDLHHAVPDAAECTGFAHQDLRSDNILLSSAGDVVLCDFELVAHVVPDDSARALLLNPFPAECATAAVVNPGRRIIPADFHAPEGPNQAKSDTWLIGLITLELFTGINPLVRSVVAHDDFGDGPYLSVDASSGIDWANLRRHVHTRVRAFPSTPDDSSSPSGGAGGFMDPLIAQYCAATGVDAFEELHAFSQLLEDFCSMCLANDPDTRAEPEALLKHELFDRMRTFTGGKPRDAIRRWVSTVGLKAAATGSPTKGA